MNDSWICFCFKPTKKIFDFSYMLLTNSKICPLSFYIIVLTKTSCWFICAVSWENFKLLAKCHGRLPDHANVRIRNICPDQTHVYRETQPHIGRQIAGLYIRSFWKTVFDIVEFLTQATRSTTFPLFWVSSSHCF